MVFCGWVSLVLKKDINIDKKRIYRRSNERRSFKKTTKLVARALCVHTCAMAGAGDKTKVIGTGKKVGDGALHNTHVWPKDSTKGGRNGFRPGGVQASIQGRLRPTPWHTNKKKHSEPSKKSQKQNTPTYSLHTVPKRSMRGMITVAICNPSDKGCRAGNRSTLPSPHALLGS